MPYYQKPLPTRGPDYGPLTSLVFEQNFGQEIPAGGLSSSDARVNSVRGLGSLQMSPVTYYSASDQGALLSPQDLSY